MKIAVTAAFGFIVNKTVNWPELVTILRNIPQTDLAIAFLLGGCGIFFGAKRWEHVLRILGFRPGTRESLRTYLWGNTLAFITPGRVGELFRGVGGRAGRISDSVVAVFLDKVLIVAAILIWANVCLVVQYFRYRSFPAKWFVIAQGIFLLGSVGITATAIVYFPRSSPGAIGRYINKTSTFIRVCASPAGIRCIGYSLLTHFTLLFQTTYKLFGLFKTDILLLGHPSDLLIRVHKNA